MSVCQDLGSWHRGHGNMWMILILVLLRRRLRLSLYLGLVRWGLPYSGRWRIDHIVKQVGLGNALGDVSSLYFRHPNQYRPGELHRHFSFWQDTAGRYLFPQHQDVLGWIRNRFPLSLIFAILRDDFNKNDMILLNRPRKCSVIICHASRLHSLYPRPFLVVSVRDLVGWEGGSG